MTGEIRFENVSLVPKLWSAQNVDDVIGLKQCLRALSGQLNPMIFINVLKMKLMEPYFRLEKVHVIWCELGQNVTFDLRSRGQFFQN